MTGRTMKMPVAQEWQSVSARLPNSEDSTLKRYQFNIIIRVRVRVRVICLCVLLCRCQRIVNVLFFNIFLWIFMNSKTVKNSRIFTNFKLKSRIIDLWAAMPRRVMMMMMMMMMMVWRRSTRRTTATWTGSSCCTPLLTASRTTTSSTCSTTFNETRNIRRQLSYWLRTRPT